MTLEKTFLLPTGRAVKVITKVPLAENETEVRLGLDVLIKDPKEEDFRHPIGMDHPKYWKLKKLDSRQSKIVEIQYSGISDKQIRKAVMEFKQTAHLQQNFNS